MIFDTDVMIWAFRGNGKALDATDKIHEYNNETEQDVWYCTTDVTLTELNEFLAQGCVFLPRSGSVFGEGDWYNGGFGGYYWSSTQEPVGNAWYLFFYRGGVPAECGLYKSSLFLSVRLVRE